MQIHKRVQDLKRVGTFGMPGDVFVGRLCLPRGAVITKIVEITYADNSEAVRVEAECGDPMAPKVERDVRLVMGVPVLSGNEALIQVPAHYPVAVVAKMEEPCNV